MLALAGCYHPAAEVACPVRCPDGACPDGLTCGADGLCHAGSAACPNIDAPSDNPNCFGHGLLRVCLTETPPDTLVLLGFPYVIDTNSSCDPVTGADGMCVIVAGTMGVGGASAQLRATGSRPLVVVRPESVVLSGLGQRGSVRVWQGRETA